MGELPPDRPEEYDGPEHTGSDKYAFEETEANIFNGEGDITAPEPEEQTEPLPKVDAAEKLGPVREIIEPALMILPTPEESREAHSALAKTVEMLYEKYPRVVFFNPEGGGYLKRLILRKNDSGATTTAFVIEGGSGYCQVRLEQESANGERTATIYTGKDNVVIQRRMGPDACQQRDEIFRSSVSDLPEDIEGKLKEGLKDVRASLEVERLLGLNSQPIHADRIAELRQKLEGLEPMRVSANGLYRTALTEMRLERQLTDRALPSLHFAGINFINTLNSYNLPEGDIIADEFGNLLTIQLADEHFKDKDSGWLINYFATIDWSEQMDSGELMTHLDKLGASADTAAGVAQASRRVRLKYETVHVGEGERHERKTILLATLTEIIKDQSGDVLYRSPNKPAIAGVATSALFAAFLNQPMIRKSKG